MQNDILNEPTFAPKIYGVSSIVLAAFLGGPLAAGYLMAQNFKSFDKPEQAKNTWIISVLATMVIIAISFAVSNNQDFPGYLIPVIYLSATNTIARSQQGADIKTHIANGFETYSIWRGVLVGLISLIIWLTMGCIIYLIVS